MERAAIYARVSTDTQRDNYSIPSQISECVRYANKRGYTVVADQYINPENGYGAPSGNGSTPAYVDDYSSRELSRPGLDAALLYLERVGYDVLIVLALDRLARDPYIRQTLEREFSTRGAKIEYVQGSYEETPEGEVRKDLDATFAKWENAKRVERSNRGKRRKAERGLFVGGRPPYGYFIDKNSFGGLAINQAEADVVRKIFYYYVEESYSIREIARLLDVENTPTRLGGETWGKSSIPKILSNPVYVGYFFYNKYKRVGKQLVERDPVDWIRIETLPIIDEWIFNQAQKKLEENRVAKRTHPTRFYLLSGMVTCCDCHRPYITQTAKAGTNRRINEAPFYRHRAKEGHCANRTISARILEPRVWAEVSAILLDPDRLRRGYYESLVQQEASRARQKEHLESLRKGLIKLEKAKQNLTTLYIDPDIGMTRTEYLEQKARIDIEIRAAMEETTKIETEIVNMPIPADFESLEKFADKIRDCLEKDYYITPEEKRNILELLHIKVFLGLDGSTRIDGWYNDEKEGESINCDCLLSTLSSRPSWPAA